MRKSRFTEEQIAYAIRQVEQGTPAADLCRKMGISEQTFYTMGKRARRVTRRERVLNPRTPSAKSRTLVGPRRRDEHRHPAEEGQRRRQEVRLSCRPLNPRRRSRPRVMSPTCPALHAQSARTRFPSHRTALPFGPLRGSTPMA